MPSKRYPQKPSQFRSIAKERILKLFAEAERQDDLVLADRYVHIARRLAAKYKVPLPLFLKRRVCRHCHRYLVPGRTVRVRLQQRRVLYTCRACNRQTRIPYVREQKKKRL